jgi:hypothetical protein
MNADWYEALNEEERNDGSGREPGEEKEWSKECDFYTGSYLLAEGSGSFAG